ncbi:uncharacterized protein LOC131231436 [Magnolia sinica]|uniref:uncharacterized protein LOC131231436 n=1 Tax=Magnolia sinica TaxID=86752 RepID=UPI00265A39CE|nr:uncharacterized protein LOC131231436 [Magnolia sinica]
MAFRCSLKSLVVLVLLSAIPLSLIIALERTKSATHAYEYHSNGWLRECAKWDDQGRRFLVSLMEGGVSQLTVPDDQLPGAVLEEELVVRDADVAGNGSLGIRVDRSRSRLLVVHADIIGNRYGALAAYDLRNWNRLFLTQLSGPGDEKSLADDVAVDDVGNAYITDAASNKIWKVGMNGEILSIIRSPIFKQRKEWYYNLVGLNGIVYHPNGFLLVVHTASGYLFKIDVVKEEISTVEIVKGSLSMGDGLDLLSPTQIVVAGTPSGRLVESLDGWDTAKVVGRYVGPMHRLATSATLKDGRVYLNHMFGGGIPKRKHIITEAVFRTLG